jgi:LPXTG-site transpeptidase (sortase) family protein
MGQTLAHVLGNVFLGIAIGLVGYHFATDLLTELEQRSLTTQFPAEEAVAAPADEDAPFDWEGWEEEDLEYWEGLSEGDALGRLVCDEMDLDAVVVKGTTRSVLMKGPGWITYTDLPGPEGNFGVAGHRTTYGAPFRQMDKLSAGDLITFTSPFRVYTYEVTELFEVTPDRVDVMDTTDDPSLTMSACHPPYSARLRLIARSKLVSVQRIDQ